jgi:serine/threonine-protein kinase
MEEQFKQKILTPEEFSLDGYTFGHLIGVGGVGAVYAGKNSEGQGVAVKIMEETPFIDAQLLDNIIDGVLATRKIPEPANIVKIYDAGKQGQKYYIIMELFERGTLERLIGVSDLSIKDRLEIMFSMAKTLACVHGCGMIHGDLKPENVLMGDNNVPSLNDFYHASPKIKGSHFIATPQGTPRYMSPEQAMGKLVTHASDIYSFGVLFYEFLTGRLPYKMDAENMGGMLDAINKSDLLPATKFSGIGNKLNAVLMKLLVKDPSGRYKSMKTVAEDINACIKGTAVSIPYRRSLIEFLKHCFVK